MTVHYNAESRHWRDADRWRAYGWAGYRVGDRAIHYWGQGAVAPTRMQRARMVADRAIKRDLYLDAGHGDDATLAHVVRQIESFRPTVLVVFTQAAVRLAHFVIDRGLRTWDPIPVLCGAEKVWPADRATLEAAFGPVFETYGCREVQLIASECEHHQGMHASVEKLVVELVVRDPAAPGGARAARPGEVGEVAVTDLHNLAQPLIRYLTGDVATAMAPAPCPCGRTLPRFGSVEGRVAEMLYDRDGKAVSGLLFSILFVAVAARVQQFQVAQHADRSIELRVVPLPGGFPAEGEQLAREYIAKYLPGIPFKVSVVDDIPVAPSGKRRVVVVDPAAKTAR
jgi:phenylacetate-CoA ligase